MKNKYMSFVDDTIFRFWTLSTKPESNRIKYCLITVIYEVSMDL